MPQFRINEIIYRTFSAFLILTFLSSSVFPSQYSFAQSVLSLPKPGTALNLTPNYRPMVIQGLNIHPTNPLEFNFIIDQGDENLKDDALRAEADKLVKYFMASLAIPENQMWVNLSPYEKNRIVPDQFGQTEMGRDLLAQDYMLKQLTASLLNPEAKIGDAFWKEIQEKAKGAFGNKDIPMSTFNKIWIIPDTAKIYEHTKGAYVVKTHLKVQLEEDYLAMDVNKNSNEHGLGDISAEDLKKLSSDQTKVMREIVIPAIEREVNEGKIFAQLRQIYNSMILARWYKKNLKESLLGKEYVNKANVTAIAVEDKQANAKIYNQYLAAFKQGAYNFIKEDYVVATQEIVAKKYFTGGLNLENTAIESANETERSVAISANKNPLSLDVRVGDRSVGRRDPNALRIRAITFEPKITINNEQTFQYVFEQSPNATPLYDSVPLEQLSGRLDVGIILDDLIARLDINLDPNANYYVQTSSPQSSEKTKTQNLKLRELYARLEYAKNEQGLTEAIIEDNMKKTGLMEADEYRMKDLGKGKFDAYIVSEVKNTFVATLARQKAFIVSLESIIKRIENEFRVLSKVPKLEASERNKKRWMDFAEKTIDALMSEVLAKLQTEYSYRAKVIGNLQGFDGEGDFTYRDTIRRMIAVEGLTLDRITVFKTDGDVVILTPRWQFEFDAKGSQFKGTNARGENKEIDLNDVVKIESLKADKKGDRSTAVPANREREIVQLAKLTVSNSSSAAKEKIIADAIKSDDIFVRLVAGIFATSNMLISVSELNTKMERDANEGLVSDNSEIRYAAAAVAELYSFEDLTEKATTIFDEFENDSYFNVFKGLSELPQLRERQRIEDEADTSDELEGDSASSAIRQISGELSSIIKNKKADTLLKILSATAMLVHNLKEWQDDHNVARQVIETKNKVLGLRDQLIQYGSDQSLRNLEKIITMGLDPSASLAIKETRDEIERVAKSLNLDMKDVDDFTSDMHKGAIWKRAKQFKDKNDNLAKLWLVIAYLTRDGDKSKEGTEEDFVKDVSRVVKAWQAVTIDQIDVLAQTALDVLSKEKLEIINDVAVTRGEWPFLSMALRGHEKGVWDSGASTNDPQKRRLFYVASTELPYAEIATKNGFTATPATDDPKKTIYTDSNGVEVMKSVNAGYGIVFNNETLAIELAAAAKASDRSVGGIDLNPEMLSTDIQKQGQGFVMPKFTAPVGGFNADRAVPIIINIRPIINLPQLLGMAIPKVDDTQLSNGTSLKTRQVDSFASL